MLKRLCSILIVMLLCAALLPATLAQSVESEDPTLSNITDIIRLEKNYVTFQLDIPENLTADIAAKLICADGEIPGEIQAGGKLQFTGLSPDTCYKLVVCDAADNTTIDEIAFKTFNNNGKREFQYFADVRNSDTGIVDVKIFVRSGSKDVAIKMKRPSFHMQEYDLRLVGDITVDGKIMPYGTDDFAFSAYIPANKTSVITYRCDRSYFNSPSGGCHGLMKDSFFMCCGEQFLIMPAIDYHQRGYRCSFSFITGAGWHSSVGMGATDFEMLYFSEDPVCPAANFYAYDMSEFTETTQEVYGTEITAVVENSIRDSYAEAIFSIYAMLYDCWGGSVSDMPYTLMVIDDAREIGAGEYDTGQGFATYFGIRSMIIHQLFHRWQGWDVGIRYDHATQPEGGFWLEGFNNYYAYKLLCDLPQATMSANEIMRGFYQSYKSQIRNGTDTSLLEQQPEIYAFYSKGACLAYLLDLEIQNQSGGTHSLDDVLKYFYNEFMETQAPFTYKKMLAYINTLIDGDIYDWWNKYLVYNEPFILEAFEVQDAPSAIHETSVSQSTQPTGVMTLVDHILGYSRKPFGNVEINGNNVEIYTVNYDDWIQTFIDILRKDKALFVQTFLSQTSGFTENELQHMDDARKYNAVEIILDFMLTSGLDVDYLIDNLYIDYDLMPR